MKLWVRNQERDGLAICNSLSIQPIIRSNKKISSWGIISNFGCVAEYATRERCIEIIDEIQKLLFSNFCIIRNCELDEDTAEYLKPTKAVAYFSENKTPSIEYNEQSVAVYEMPKE